MTTAAVNEPSPEVPVDRRADLAYYLRFLLGRAGLTPRQLAAEHDLPYSREMLYRYFSGDALPPPLLIEVIAEYYAGDAERLHDRYDRARAEAATAAAVTVASTGLGGSAAGSGRLIRFLRSAAPAAGAVAIIALVLGATAGVGVGRPQATDTQARPPAPPSAAPSAAPPSGPNADPGVDPSADLPTSRPARKYRPAKPSPRPKGPELIDNGTFTGTVEPWGGDGVEAEEDGNRLAADVPGGESDSPQDADVDSNDDFSLSGDRTYVLNFDAAADRDIDIGVTVQSLDIDEPVMFKEIELGSSTRHFTFTFTADDDTDEAMISFELGGHSDDYRLLVDNVSLRRTA